MKYLKTYENHKPSKLNIVGQINQIIDDAMLPIIDEGFIREPGHLDFARVYTRVNLAGKGRLDMSGDVDETGLIRYTKRNHFDDIDMYKSIVGEVENSMRIISGLSGIDFSFTFTNFYGQDKIVMEIRL